jgi:hypothetical protein
MCSLGGNCKRPVCFFAHAESELRVTPYSKLDTAASVAAQQLAELGQELDCNRSGAGAAGLLGGSCSSFASDAKGRPASSVASPGSSECGGRNNHFGSSRNDSPTNSLSVDDAAALAQLTASMAALNAPAPLLDVGGMQAALHNQHMQNGAYLADASLSGSADLSLSGAAAAGLWPMAGAGVPQQPAAAMAYANPNAFLQPQVPMLLATGALAGAAPSPAGGDVWLVPSAAAGQWPSVSAAAATRSMLAQQQQHQQRQHAFGFSAGPPAAPCAGGLAPGLPVPNLLGPTALDGWLQLDGLQAKDNALQAGLCAPQAVGMVQQQQAGSDGSQAQVMQQLLNQQAMQQLLGLLDAQAAH